MHRQNYINSTENKSKKGSLLNKELDEPEMRPDVVNQMMLEIEYREDEDGGGGEAHLSLSSNSIDSPIADNNSKNRAKKAAHQHARTTGVWANLQQAQDLINKREFSSSGSLASRILNQNNSYDENKANQSANMNNFLVNEEAKI